MISVFDEEIKNIEAEILALKTAKEYSSVRSAYSASVNVQTGLYEIIYQDTGEDIFSFVYGSYVDDNWGTVWARTPVGNTQIIEINTDKTTYPSPTQQATMTIVSSVPVVSITRIS